MYYFSLAHKMLPPTLPALNESRLNMRSICFVAIIGVSSEVRMRYTKFSRIEILAFSVVKNGGCSS